MSEKSEHEKDESIEVGSSETSADEADKVVNISFNTKNLKRYGAIAGGVVGVAAAGFFAFQAIPNTTFSDAAEACLASSDPGLTIDDDGRAMYLDGEGDESGGMNVFFQVCILRELDVPDSVFDRISNTNSSMGVQEASWDNFEMSWTYHPDNGLNVSVELK